MNHERRRRRVSGRGLRLGVVFGVWSLGTALSLLSPGCYGRECDGDVVSYGRKSGEGRMIDENTWESNPIEGEWLDFFPKRTLVLDIPALGGRIPTDPIAYVSIVRNPVGESQNFTIASGNLAELGKIRPNGLDVVNGTCAKYYVRVTLKALPFLSEVPADGDGGHRDERDAAIDSVDGASPD